MQKIQGLSLAQDFTITLLIVIFIPQEVAAWIIFFKENHITLLTKSNLLPSNRIGNVSGSTGFFSIVVVSTLPPELSTTGTVSKVLFTTILFHTGAISILVESFISTMTVIQIHSYIIVEFWFKVLNIICKNEPIHWKSRELFKFSF